MSAAKHMQDSATRRAKCNYKDRRPRAARRPVVEGHVPNLPELEAEAGPEAGAQVKTIEPENPRRLRALVSALSRHEAADVLRIEIRLAPSTDDPAVTTFEMILTHSLGPKHEMAIGAVLGPLFETAMRAIIEEQREAARP